MERPAVSPTHRLADSLDDRFPSAPARSALQPSRRRRTPGLAALILAAAAAAPAAAQQSVQDVLAEMQARITELTERVVVLTDRTVALETALAEARAGNAPPEDEFYIPRMAADFQQSGLPPAFGGVYTKPFLANLGQRTYLGGYINVELESRSGSANHDAFDLAPFVPFIYADVSDRVKVSSELEFDHGHEVEVEFAQMDYLFDDAVNLRAGVQLLPVGKFNEVHDAPIQELTQRPLVDTLVIPTTLRDVGVGLWGRLSDSVSYQATVTNGFRGLDAAGNTSINLEEGLHGAAPHEGDLGEPFEQANDQLAYAARVAFQPVLGVEAGASTLVDTYDENGDNGLTICALDATIDGRAVGFLPDSVELVAEAAWAEIERDAFAMASGVPGDMSGYYIQANCHLDPAWLDSWKRDGTVDEAAHFTFVTRYDRAHLDTYDRRRVTFGLNFRPDEQDTVFKIDYQIDSDSGSMAGAHDDDALLFSVATYF